ncbi:MAG: hypothetical protein Kow00124_06000 [Anaerolineae bacterium]
MADQEHEHSPHDDDQIVDGEIVAEYADHTLVNLPQMEPPEEARDDDTSPNLPAVPDSSRRRFLGRLLLGGVSALALGGSAALLYYSSRRDEPLIVVLPNNDQNGQPARPTAVDVAGLAARVNELENERDSLIAQRDQLQLELEEARAALADAQALNSLWRALDDTGLDGIVAGALAFLSGLFATLLPVTVLLRSGMSRTRDNLTAFTAALPGPQDGILWLQAQVSGLAAALDWLGQKIQEVIEPVEPYTELIAGFILWVLDRLPFGAGARARAALDAMQVVVNSLPDHIEGLNTTVLDPLAEWFGRDEDRNLLGMLVKPVDTLVLQPAQRVVDDFAALEHSYQEQLAVPAQSALEQRATLRAQIDTLQARIESRGQAVS